MRGTNLRCVQLALFVLVSDILLAMTAWVAVDIVLR